MAQANSGLQGECSELGWDTEHPLMGEKSDAVSLLPGAHMTGVMTLTCFVSCSLPLNKKQSDEKRGTFL